MTLSSDLQAPAPAPVSDTGHDMEAKLLELHDTLSTQLGTEAEQLAAVLNELDDVAWIARPEGDAFLFISDGAERLFGYSAQDLLDDPTLWGTIINPDDHPLLVKAEADLHAQGEADITYRIYHRDGHTKSLRSRTYLRTDDQGRPVQRFGLFSEVEPHAAPASLETMRAVAEGFGRTHAVDFLVCDADGAVLYMSPDASTRWGLDLERWNAEPGHTLTALDEVRQTGQPVRGHAQSFAGTYGGHHTLIFDAAPVLTGPAAGCVVLIAHREARQSRTLEVLERYQEELEASMQAVRQALGQARDRIQDLHERAEAEEASPAYAFPLDAVPYPMAILDRDGRLTSANDAFAEVMAAAYRTTVQPGTRLTDQMHPSDELVWAEMQSRVLEGQAVSREIQRATNDRVRTFDLHMTPIRHEGHLQGATCTLHEITETVERAAAPAQDTLLYATLARHIPGGTVMVFDRDLRFTHVDGDDVQVREVLKEMLEGERMPEILPPELAQRLEPLFHQALSGHDVQDHMDVMGQDMDLRVLPLRSQAGRVEAAMMISIERTPSEAAPPVSSQAPALTITPGADLFPRPPQVNAPTRPHQEARSWPPASAQAHGDAASVHPLFSLFFDALPQPTLVVDEHDRVVELNEAAHRVAGLDHHAVRRHAVREVFGDGLADRIQDARLVLAEGDAQATYCTHVEERGGLQEIQHQVEIAPVAGLERPHLLIQWREVETSRYSALAAEAYRTLLRTVVSHVPQVVFWKNRDGVYQGCNALFARLMGAQTPSDVIGRTDRDFFWGDEARLDLEAREHAVLAGEEDQVRTLEEYRTDNGRLLRIRATRVPLRNRDGHAVGLLGVYEAAR